MDRVKTTQDLAAANVEQRRLNQKASGMVVLGMKDERDGVVDEELEAACDENTEALDRTMEKINRLEKRLSDLDEELRAAMEKER
ncbi:hypothetical protein [Leisingera sp.]|uniref:hypothetical protein n=1 Tax=Leisingera sp. TaxID=1879318 RepID=UPI002B26E977|nr:hypothetical protein [Leisingera sp.]